MRAQTEAPVRRLALKVVHRVEELAPFIAPWDELAQQRGLPYCSPHWLLPWWNHVAPSKASLHVIAVWEGSELVAIAPFFALTARTGGADYHLLGHKTSPRVEPLCAEGFELVAGRLFADALGRENPRARLVCFDGIPANSSWPRLLADAWPGARPWIHTELLRPAPTVELCADGYDAWLANKSKNFRQQMRRSRRKLDERQAVARLPQSGTEIKQSLADFARLHRARWDSRGGSRVLDRRVEDMLAEVAEVMPAGSRFRLWTIEASGQTISAHIFLSAGGEVSYWLGGFDEAWAPLHPSMLTIAAALEHSLHVGDRRLDLNSGAQPYKYRFADDEDQLAWKQLVPRGRTSLITSARLIRRDLVRKAYERLSEPTRERIKRTLSTLRKLGSIG